MRTVNTIRCIALAVFVFLPGLVSAQDLPEGMRQCGLQYTQQSVHAPGDTGGFYCSSIGTLRVLIVFASFPDDETPNPYWPPHAPPIFMQQLIDPDTATHSQGLFNLTNYFSQMSLGKFHFVGEAIWVETAHSQEEYRNGSYGRANLNVLQERVDPVVDFSSYDHWTMDGPYSHVNVPDGQVDMVIMVWRTAMWEFLGEASLGYKPGFLADGKRIEMGFPTRFDFPLGSGVTCKFPYTDTPYQAMQTMIHEFSHWLLGGPHPYNGTTIFDKHAYWGLLCDGHRVSSCANSYERERLGWVHVPELQPDVDVSLPDYVSSGISRKYHPANGSPGEYFYFENHQQESVFDDVTTNPEDKGLWILHQQGPYLEMDNLKIVSSDGNWNWENPGATTNCYAQNLPIFKRGTPEVLMGESHRDQIPTQTSLVNWMLVYKDAADQVSCGTFFRGEKFVGTFKVDVNPVFSGYSNPATSTWDHQPTGFSMEVMNDQNGGVIIRYHSNALDVPPARRYLGANPDVHDTLSGRLYIAWGTQWPDGQPLEADVNWSEVQRQLGNAGDWIPVYAGSLTAWSDEGVYRDTSGATPVTYRARVRDMQGRYSAWSNVFSTKAFLPTPVNKPTTAPENRYELESNFPNPFNPTTTIGFRIQVSGFTTLKVYDVLGREVRTLVNEELKPGRHVRTFDAGGLSSGVYFYRLQTDEFIATKRLLVVK